MLFWSVTHTFRPVSQIGLPQCLHLRLVSIIFSYAYPKEGSRVYPEGFPAAIKIHSEYHVAQGKLGSHLLFPFDLGLHQFHKLPDLILRQGQSRINVHFPGGWGEQFPDALQLIPDLHQEFGLPCHSAALPLVVRRLSS